MKNDEWRARLEQGIKDKGKKARSVSLAADLNPGYVHSLLRENKDPTIDNFLKICEAAGLSAYTVLTGIKMTPETEQLLMLVEKMSASGRVKLLEFLREQESRAPSPELLDDDDLEDAPTTPRSPSMSP